LANLACLLAKISNQGSKTGKNMEKEGNLHEKLKVLQGTIRLGRCQPKAKPGLVDRKIFLEQAFAIFFCMEFWVEFAEACRICRICRARAEIFKDLANSRRHGENEPKKQFLKIRQ
jgi:hypothetical protein